MHVAAPTVRGTARVFNYNNDNDDDDFVSLTPSRPVDRERKHRKRHSR